MQINARSKNRHFAVQQCCWDPELLLIRLVDIEMCINEVRVKPSN